MYRRYFRSIKNEESVSPLVAVIIIVAIVIILAAVLYMWLAGIAQEGGIGRVSVPTAVFEMKNSGESMDDWNMDNNIATITLTDGEVPISTLNVLASPDGDAFIELDDWDTTPIGNPTYWEAGESLIISEDQVDDLGENFPSDTCYVRIVYEPADKILYTGTVTIEQSAPDSQPPQFASIEVVYPQDNYITEYGWFAAKNDSISLRATITDDLSGVANVTLFNADAINRSATGIPFAQVGETNQWRCEAFGVEPTDSFFDATLILNATDRAGHEKMGTVTVQIINNYTTLENFASGLTQEVLTFFDAGSQLTSLRLPRDAAITENSASALSITGEMYDGRYPQNPSIDIGNDGDIDWRSTASDHDPARPYLYDRSVGTQLFMPFGVAYDDAGDGYVADVLGRTVEVYDADGAHQRTIEMQNADMMPFAVNATAEYTYVATNGFSKFPLPVSSVQRFDEYGNYRGRILASPTPTIGQDEDGNIDIDGATVPVYLDVAVDNSGFIYILRNDYNFEIRDSPSGEDLLVTFDSSIEIYDQNLIHRHTIPFGANEHEFDYTGPLGIAVDDDYLVVTNHTLLSNKVKAPRYEPQPQVLFYAIDAVDRDTAPTYITNMTLVNRSNVGGVDIRVDHNGNNTDLYIAERWIGGGAYRYELDLTNIDNIDRLEHSEPILARMNLSDIEQYFAPGDSTLIFPHDIAAPPADMDPGRVMIVDAPESITPIAELAPQLFNMSHFNEEMEGSLVDIRLPPPVIFKQRVVTASYQYSEREWAYEGRLDEKGFKNIWDIAVDEHGRLFASDPTLGRVQVFDAALAYETSIVPQANRANWSLGLDQALETDVEQDRSRPGMRFYPYAVDIGPEGKIYISIANYNLQQYLGYVRLPSFAPLVSGIEVYDANLSYRETVWVNAHQSLSLPGGLDPLGAFTSQKIEKTRFLETENMEDMTIPLIVTDLSVDEDGYVFAVGSWFLMFGKVVVIGPNGMMLDGAGFEDMLYTPTAVDATDGTLWVSHIDTGFETMGELFSYDPDDDPPPPVTAYASCYRYDTSSPLQPNCALDTRINLSILEDTTLFNTFDLEMLENLSLYLPTGIAAQNGGDGFVIADSFPNGLVHSITPETDDANPSNGTLTSIGGGLTIDTPWDHGGFAAPSKLDWHGDELVIADNTMLWWHVLFGGSFYYYNFYDQETPASRLATSDEGANGRALAGSSMSVSLLGAGAAFTYLPPPTARVEFYRPRLPYERTGTLAGDTLAAELNDYLRTHQADAVDGYIHVPIRVNAKSAGRVRLHALELEVFVDPTGRDTTPPAISAMTPSTGTTVLPGTQFEVECSVTDSASITAVRCDASALGATTLLLEASAPSSSVYQGTITVTGQHAGDYPLIFSATDSWGNTATANTTVTLAVNEPHLTPLASIPFSGVPTQLDAAANRIAWSNRTADDRSELHIMTVDDGGGITWDNVSSDHNLTHPTLDEEGDALAYLEWNETDAGARVVVASSSTEIWRSPTNASFNSRNPPIAVHGDIVAYVTLNKTLDKRRSIFNMTVHVWNWTDGAGGTEIANISRTAVQITDIAVTPTRVIWCERTDRSQNGWPYEAGHRSIISAWDIVAGGDPTAQTPYEFLNHSGPHLPWDLDTDGETLLWSSHLPWLGDELFIQNTTAAQDYGNISSLATGPFEQLTPILDGDCVLALEVMLYYSSKDDGAVFDSFPILFNRTSGLVWNLSALAADGTDAGTIFPDYPSLPMIAMDDGLVAWVARDDAQSEAGTIEIYSLGWN